MTEPSDDLGERLGRMLRRRASAVPTRLDEDDLLSRTSRRARRTRNVLITALVVAVLASSSASYAVGRGGGDDGVGVHIAAGGTEPAADLDADMDAYADAPHDPGIVGYIDGSDANWYGPTLGRLLVRTTDEGIVLRAHHGRYDAHEARPPGWDPPGWCGPDGLVRVGIVTDEATGVVIGERFAEPRDGLDGTVMPTGLAEGTPIWVVVAQASEGDSVRATFPSGATDTAELVDGVTVLAAHAPSSANDARNDLWSGVVTLDALEDGGVVGSSELAAESSEGPAGFVEDPECLPPPRELPPPGEQPADAEGARAAVIAAYETLVGPTPWPDKVHLLEDGPALTAVAEEAARGATGDDVVAATVVVSDLVFVAPDHAWVRFDLLVGEQLAAADNFGQAVLRDGQWQMARSSWCELISLAGVVCPP